MPVDQENASAFLAAVLKAEVATHRIKEGDVVEAELIAKAPRAAYFDLGRLGAGIVYGAELQNARQILKTLAPGDRAHAKVVALDGEGGYVELSLAEAGRQRVWKEAQDLQESGEIVKFKATGSNTGGLVGTIANMELRAFLPLSQLSNEHAEKFADGDREKATEELKKFVGEELSVKVINANAKANKLIVSERETLGTNVKELLAQYQIGQTVDAMVSGLADFGIFMRFVDNPQIEGLVHISEIDYRLIDNPKEVMKLNETAQVKIIDIKEGRVFLSLKALKPDPWLSIEEKHKEGETVTGTIYKFNPFGAIVDLPSGLQGMVHISEFGGTDEMKKAIALGESYPFTIDTIKKEERRIILKMKK